jgi:adenylyl-sulfate kinase
MVERNLVWHDCSISREKRWQLVGTHGCTVWFTGLPASGKSTLASALERVLIENSYRAYRLDGDNIRHGLNNDLGFSVADRAENIRRISEVARLFADSGCVALTAFISPYVADRDRCRALHQRDGLPFLEVFLDTPLAVCEMRDPKGMYKKARAGQLKGFTGVDDPYEPPPHPELVLNTGILDIATCIEACLDLLRRHQVIA